MEDYFEYDIPSKRRQVLEALNGSIVTRLVRFSWEPGAELNRSREECGLPPKPKSTGFSLASGPVLMWLDSGAIVGACSESSLISVTLGFERDEKGGTCEDPVESDEDLHPIEAADEQYSSKQIADIVGKRIVRVSVLKRQPNNAKSEDRPREAGVVLEFDGGSDLVLSHGLFYEADDDFQVITRSQIHPSVVSKLDEFGLEDINGLTP